MQAWLRSVAVRLHGAASGTDLGCSSEYSNGNFEDRRGEGFRVNSDCTRVRRH